MRGVILSFDTGSGTGTITGDDGQSYGFDRASLTTPAAIRDGLRVDFSPVDGQATQIMLLEAAAPAQSGSTPWSSTSSVPATGAVGYDFAKAMFSFDGRLRRQHFWISWLILLGAGVVLGWIPFLGFLISVALIWPNLAIAVKRLHDMGRTGWLILIPIVANVIGWVVALGMIGMGMAANGWDQSSIENDPAAAMGLMGPAFAIIGLLMLVNLGFLLWTGIQEGQPGTNRFGPNPKNPVDADVFG